MIARLTGRMAEKGLGRCVLDVGGVGYAVRMSTSSLALLPAEGSEVTVLTHLHVREDEMTLYGFLEAEERELFEALITVSGVGPRVALAALSAMSPSALRSAIVEEDVAMVATTPGIGKKTAQRLVLELKDRLLSSGSEAGTRAEAGGMQAEAREALLSMGFSPAEVSAAVRESPSVSSSEELLREALRRLGGAA